MAYLVDTNILVDVTRGSMTAAAYVDRLAGAWSISAITCLELLAGARTQRETTDLRSGTERIPRDPSERGNRPPGILPHEELRALTWIAGP